MLLQNPFTRLFSQINFMLGTLWRYDSLSMRHVKYQCRLLLVYLFSHILRVKYNSTCLRAMLKKKKNICWIPVKRCCGMSFARVPISLHHIRIWIYILEREPWIYAQIWMVVLICTPGLDLEVNMSVPAPKGEKTQNQTENRNVSVFHSPEQVSVSM